MRHHPNIHVTWRIVCKHVLVSGLMIIYQCMQSTHVHISSAQVVDSVLLFHFSVVLVYYSLTKYM